jgi:uncharacterized protein YbaR (Trm112 family)
MLVIGCPIDHGGYLMCWQAEQKKRLTTSLYDKTDDLYFPIGIMILHEDLATFQQHLYLEYNLQVDTVFRNLWILSGFPLWKVAANKEAIEQVIRCGYANAINALWPL